MPTDDRVRVHGPVTTLATGAGGGLVLGALARAWMRLVSDDPAFSWAGTISILLVFAVFSTAQAVSGLARERARRRWVRRVGRTAGAVGIVGLLTGAGAIMLPTIVAGGLGLARPEWPRVGRVVCLVVALVPVALVGVGLVDEFGWSVRLPLGVGGLAALYGVIGWRARATFAAPPGAATGGRWRSAPVVVALVLSSLVAGLLLVGFGGDGG